MKICFDARVVLNNQTGLGNYTYNLLKYLLKLDQKSEYSVLLNKTLRKDHPIVELQNKNLKKIYTYIPEVTAQQQLLMPLKLIKLKPDIYHYPHFDVPVLQPYNSVFTVHDLTYLKSKLFYTTHRTLKYLYTYVIMKLGAHKAKKIIAVSRSTKVDLTEILRIPEKKIEVIPEAVDETYFNGRITTVSISSLNGLNKSDKYFLAIGERRPHKNIVRLIEAFALLKKKKSNEYKLVIVGKPYFSYSEPEKKVVELGLSKDVILLGYVTNEILRILYQKAVCFMYISLYEGFGLPILEAMTCGTPVITSDVSSMPEVAGNAALTVNPFSVQEIFEAMEEITQNSILRRQLIKRGKKRVKRFSWEKTAQSTLELYESIVKMEL